MALYTRTGDAGQTSLYDGTRVSKADPRIDAVGHVDELNALVGIVRAIGVDAGIDEWLAQIQRDLFAVGARLADPAERIAARVEKAAMTQDDVARLERWIDEAESALTPLRHFVLPGGCPAAAALHHARTVCRRAERQVVALGVDTVAPGVIPYLNRLSDLLFALARLVNHRAGVADLQW